MLCSRKNCFRCPSLPVLSDVIRVKIRLVTKPAAAHIILLLALALGFASTMNAQTTANSCSQTDVQSAVNNAGRKGTVLVPAGSCSWGSTLTLTYGITLTGAGVGSTVITSNITPLALHPDAIAIANGENIKITGFTFDGNASADTLVELEGASGITGTRAYCCYIIGDNKFQNTSPSSSNGVFQAQPNSNGQLRGVIYHNTFDRCNIIIRPFSNNDTGEWANTAFNNFSYGSSDNLYFEDNTIQFSSSYSGNNPGWIESGQGGRIVGRFNTWNLANATTPQEVWDIHGFQNWNGTINSGQTSTMIVEYYDNILINMGTYRWINHRGSWGMFFDNTLTGSGGNSIEVNEYYPGVPGGSGCPAQINPTPINYNPVVNNTYAFNNALNGSRNNMVPGIIGNGCGIAENSNYWNQQTSFNGTVGVGRGTKASMPATCTSGVGFWVTDEGSWNTKLAANSSGRFYKCVSPNNWQLYFTPYTYPHPLRTGSQTSVSPPTNLTSVVH
jgi:hypothetical protein